MTRLVKKDIAAMDKNLNHLDRLLEAVTGKSLLEIGAFAMGKALPLIPTRIAVVPITTGLGIIQGFSETVTAILVYLGADAFTTEKTDVRGLQEAFSRGAEVVFMADDQTFSAFHFKNGSWSDNGDATGRGFAAALYLAAKAQAQMEVLVLGAGAVGQAAIEFLLEKNISVVLGEIDQDKARACGEKYQNIKVAADWTAGRYHYIVEATPIADLIKTKNITDQSIIAAPGVPFGVAPAAAKKADQIIHNLLELGVATMLSAIS
ncbi:3-methylornithyl-N6-L-lysine dehydrogenase PylD [Acetobacterium sp.]|uniref:3-methylornithyl-N6-L-lysine dehydrogenase PylD n=1 Tax=Acetobacterium sp. TaxID=1872094 RepID=UPI0035936D8D